MTGETPTLVAECLRCAWSEEEYDPPPLPHADAMTTAFPAWTFDPYPLCQSCTKEHAMTVLSSTIFDLEYTASLLEDRQEKLAAASVEVQQSLQARQRLAHLHEYTQRVLTGEVPVTGPLLPIVPITQEHPAAPVPPMEATSPAAPTAPSNPEAPASSSMEPPVSDPVPSDPVSVDAAAQEAPAVSTAGETEPPPRTLKERVLLDIAGHPGTTGAEVIARLGEPKTRLQPVISAAKHTGLIKTTTTDIPYEYRLTAAGQEVVTALAPDAPPPEVTADADPDPEDSPPVPLAEPPGPATAEEPATPAPEPTTGPQLDVKAPPVPPVRPRPGSNLARLLEQLEQDGPATAADLAQATGIHLKEVDRTVSNLLARQLIEYRGMYAPSVYQVPGESRAYQPSQVVAAGRQIPQEELRAALQGHMTAVLKVMKPGREYTESELLKATGLAISHLRRAIASLIDESTLRRLEGPTPAARAVYLLDTFEFKCPTRKHLSPADQKVLTHLHGVTTRGGRESITALADRLRLTREDVQAALAMLHARGWLKWTRVGALALYSLTTAGLTEGQVAA